MQQKVFTVFLLPLIAGLGLASTAVLAATGDEFQVGEPKQLQGAQLIEDTPELIEAIELIETGKLRSAIKLLKALVDRDGDSALAHYYLGLAYSKKLKREHALKSFRRAVAVDPTLGKAYCEIGVLLEEARESFDDAIDAHEKCLRFAPNTGASHFGLGKIYFHKEEYDRSREAFQAAFELRETLTLELRFAVAMSLGQSLLQVLNKPVRWLQDLDRTHDQLVGKRYRRYGNFQEMESLEMFRTSLMPEGNDVLKNTIAESSVYLNDARTIKPQDPEPLGVLGAAYYNHFLLALDPNSLRIASQHFKSAVTVAEESNDLVGDTYAGASYVLGLMALNEKKFEDALTYLGKAKESYIPLKFFFSMLGPTWKELIVFYMAVCFEELGELEEAVRHYRMAIERHQFSYSPYIRIGEIYLRKGEWALAVKTWMEPGMTREEWKEHGHPEEEYQLFPAYARQGYNQYETAYLYYLLAKLYYDRCQKEGECMLDAALEYATESVQLGGYRVQGAPLLLKALEGQREMLRKSTED